MDLLDPIDLLSMGYTDTVQVSAYSITEDSVSTHNLNFAMIGSMYDPIFGKTSADFYSQVLLSTTRVRFGTNPVFDSAFIYLPYLSAYGDTMSNMTFRVYSLTETIYDSVHIYSNSRVSYDEANPIGELTFQPRPHDSAYYEGSSQAPYLRIPLNSVFGNYILNTSDTNALNTDDNFVKFFKGIVIKADPQNTPGKGSIIAFNIPTKTCRISMHYHNTEDTLSYSFLITDGSSRFQHYDHNGYAEATPMLRQQLQGDTLLGKQFLFAQGLSGVKIKLNFPNLKQWAGNESIVINDAQLIFGNASASEVFSYPSSVTLRAVGEGGSTSPYTLVDESEGAGYFDGTYNKASNTYRFRLTRYLQQVLTGKANNNGLHLIVPGSSYIANRLVLNGTSSPQADVKLYIKYTRLK
jgi:hypothetical protein